MPKPENELDIEAMDEYLSWLKDPYWRKSDIESKFEVLNKLKSADYVNRFIRMEHLSEDIQQTEEQPSESFIFQSLASYSNAPVRRRPEMSVGEMYTLLSNLLQKEHQQTRTVVEHESAELQKELLKHIREVPTASVELFSKLGFICGLFALVVQMVVGFSIINPLFLWLLVACSATGIGMAKIRQATLKKVK